MLTPETIKSFSLLPNSLRQRRAIERWASLRGHGIEWANVLFWGAPLRTHAPVAIRVEPGANEGWVVHLSQRARRGQERIVRAKLLGTGDDAWSFARDLAQAMQRDPDRSRQLHFGTIISRGREHVGCDEAQTALRKERRAVGELTVRLEKAHAKLRSLGVDPYAGAL